MRIILTGACGYIGCWATRKLLDAGHDVVAVEKGFFPNGVRYVESLGVPIITSDIRDFRLSVAPEFDAVLHLAGLSNDPSAQWHPQANDLMNRAATQALCEQASNLGCRRFIFASSASVYGFNDRPKLDETAPLNPCSYYAESKAQAEEYVLAIGGTVLRQATVMGWSPRHRNDLVVNTMVRSALETGRIMVNAGGEAVRPLVHVEDLVEAYVRLLEQPVEKVAGVFNIGHERTDGETFEGYTIACLALWVKHLLDKNHGVKAEVVGNWEGREWRSYDISSEKLRKTLGWEPERGASAAVDSIMAHRNELKGYDQVNIEWLKALEHGQHVVKTTGSIFVK